MFSIFTTTKEWKGEAWCQPDTKIVSLTPCSTLGCGFTYP